MIDLAAREAYYVIGRAFSLLVDKPIEYFKDTFSQYDTVKYPLGFSLGDRKEVHDEGEEKSVVTKLIIGSLIASAIFFAYRNFKTR